MAEYAHRLGSSELRGGARLSLAANDLFDSFEWRATTGSPGDPLYFDTVRDFVHRSVVLGYSTGFGSGRAAARRSTASEDERQRVQ
jgi:hypothetical protein